MELIDLVLVFNAESAAKVTSCDTTFPGAKHFIRLDRCMILALYVRVRISTGIHDLSRRRDLNVC